MTTAKTNTDSTATTLGTKGHEELMRHFESLYKGERLDREAKDLWKSGHIYQHGEVNNLFLAFRKGVAYGLAIAVD